MPFTNRRRFLAGVAGACLGASPRATAAGSDPIDAAPGDVVWTVDTEGPSISAPTIVDETVYVASENVYALDAATGSREWVFEVYETITATPTVVDGAVVVGDTFGNVYALDADTGQREWDVSVGTSAVASATVIDGTVYVGVNVGPVAALDVATGEREWTTDARYDVKSAPTVVGGTVFLGDTDDAVYALDAATGEREWAFETGSAVLSSPTVAGEDTPGEASQPSAGATVYVGSTDALVYALDAATGEPRWSFETSDWVTSCPTVAGGTVYVGNSSGVIHALDAATGEQRWSFEAGDAPLAAPTVTDGTVFVSGADALVRALDAETGAARWSTEEGTRSGSSPTVVDGTLYVGSAYGGTRVYAIDAGVEGSSDGSRVRLGTLGHHHVWADHAASDVDLSTGPPGYGGWLAGVDNYEGTVDLRGRDKVSVDVGAETEDGPYAFDPPAVLVDPGTTVVWEWVGDELPHSVSEEHGTFETDVVGESGHTFGHEFAREGIYRYRCVVHEGLGMRGAVAVGSVDDELIDPEGSSPGAPTRTPDPTDTRTPTPDPTARRTQTPDASSSVETPGPGIAGALAGLGGVAALLARRGRNGGE